MSSEALAWVFKQNIPSASVKLTLIGLCECANFKTGRCFPSIDHLEEITSQNRKTIIGNIAKLMAAGVVEDTGERVGKTRQIKVLRINTETVPKAEQFQKRNSTVFSRKESQKRDTEPSREPSSSNSISARAKKTLCPDDFWPSPTDGSKTAERMAEWQPDYLAEQVEKFIAHHQARDSKFANWQKAWQTWALNNFDGRNRNGQTIRGSGAKRAGSSFQQAIEEARANLGGT